MINAQFEASAPRPINPLPGESAPSLVLRAVRTLTPAWQLMLGSLLSSDWATAGAFRNDDLVDEVAALLRISPDVVRQMMVQGHRKDWNAVHLGPFLLLQDHVESIRRRVAPSVLSLDVMSGLEPYHRLIWAIAPLICDPITGERLIERCPSCCKGLLWTNISEVGRCGDCGQKLWRVMPERPSGPEAEVAEFMGCLFHPEKKVRSGLRAQLPEGTRDWGEADIVDLIDTLSLAPFVWAKTYPLPSPSSPHFRVDGIHLLLRGEEAINTLFKSGISMRTKQVETKRPGFQLASALAYSAILEICHISRSAFVRQYIKKFFK